MASHFQDSARSADGAQRWDQRYREGTDGWELGRPAPPLQHFLEAHPLAPRPPARVLVPGCGRGHEAALLAARGFTVVGLDFSAEALREARSLHGDDTPALAWLQVDLFDGPALERSGLVPGCLGGVLEHTCFCALEPERREAYLAMLRRWLMPGGWLLGLFWCHRRAGGPPWGSDPKELETLLRAAGLVPQLWEPARGSVQQRQQEWLGLWRRPPFSEPPATSASPPG